jgi:hypothetical protein
MTVKDYEGSSWSVEAPKISDRQKIRGKAELAAAYAPHIAKIFYRLSAKKRAYHIAGLLRQARASIPKPMKLYVIMGNHHMHTSRVMKKFVKEDGFTELVLFLRRKMRHGGTRSSRYLQTFRRRS